MSTYVRSGETVHLHGTLSADKRLVAQYGGYGINNGYSTSTDGAVLKVGGAFTNDGAIILEGSVSQQSYLPNGGSTLQNTGVLTNNGTIAVRGSAFYFGPQEGPGALLVNQGVLLNNGEIYLGGKSGLYYSYAVNTPGLLEDNGVLHNTGEVVVSAFVEGYYNFHGDSPGQLDVNGSFVNDGTLLITGGNIGYGGVGATVNVTGVLTNAADGLISGGSTEGAGWLLDVHASGTLINAGALDITFSNDTGATLEVAGLLRNSGTLELQSGSGYYQGRTGGGRLDLTGTMINTGLVAVNDLTHLLGYNFGGGGATLNDSGVLANAGEITVFGGGFKDYYGRDIQSAPGLLTDSGQLTNTASGVITLAAAASGYQGAGGAMLSVTGTLSNAGLIAIDSGTAAAAATLLVTGTLTDTGAIVGGGVLLNQGLIDNGASGEIATASLLNDGTIATAANGVFLITSDLSSLSGASGVFDIAAASTLTLTGAVAASQTAIFDGNNATLAIGDAQAFAGVLDLDQRSTTLDFLSRHVTSASATGTSLAIGFGNGTTQDYTLAAPLTSGTTIGLQTDGKGGTDVVFSSPGSADPRSSPAGAYGSHISAARDMPSGTGLLHFAQ